MIIDLTAFEYFHLAPDARRIAEPFSALAHALTRGDNVAEAGTVSIGLTLPDTAATADALNKLLLARDAALVAFQSE